MDDDARKAEVKENVLRRDGYRCVLHRFQGGWSTEIVDGQLAIYRVPPCGGPLDFGHRRHAGSGGAYVEANGNVLCRVHNGWAEDEPAAARAVGGETPWWIVVREGDPEWESLGRKAAGVR